MLNNTEDIHNKIVNIKFNNKDFEKNIADTLASLEKLNKKIDFLEKSNKALDTVAEQFKKVNLDTINNQLDAINEKMNMSGIFGKRIIENLTDNIFSLGKQIIGNVLKPLEEINSLSFKNMIGGFNQYQEVNSQIRTIMNATGKDIDEVSEKFAKLEWFSSETNQSIKEMGKAFQSIANANKDMDMDAVTNAVMGISNWGFDAGRTAQEIEHAREAITKAMAKGYVNMQDWIPISQTAQMGTADFKQLVIDTAEQYGKLTKIGENAWTSNGKDRINSDNFILTNKWFTKDIILDVLNEYAKFSDVVYQTQIGFEELGKDKTAQETMEEVKNKTDEAKEALQAYGYTLEETNEILDSFSERAVRAFNSGQKARTLQEAIETGTTNIQNAWSRIFKAIFGNTEEAEKMMTAFAQDIYQFAATGIEKVADFVEQLKEIGVIDNIFIGLINLASTFIGIIDSVKNGFLDGLGFLDINAWSDFAEFFAKFTRELVLSDDALNFIKQLSFLFGTVLRLGLDIIGSLIKIVTPFVSVTMRTLNIVMGSLGGILNAIMPLIDAICGALEMVLRLLSPIIYAVLYIIELISKIINSTIVKTINSIGTSLGSIITEFSQYIEMFVDIGYNIMNGIIGGLVSKLKDIKDVIFNIGTNILNYFKEILGIHSPSTETFEMGVNLIKGFILGIGEAIKSFAKFIYTNLKNLLSGVNEFIKDKDFAKTISESFKTILAAIWQTITTIVSSIFKGIIYIKDNIWEILNSFIIKPFLENLPRIKEKLQEWAIAVLGVLKDIFIFLGQELLKLPSRIGSLLGHIKDIFTDKDGNSILKPLFDAFNGFLSSIKIFGISVKDAIGEIGKSFSWLTGSAVGRLVIMLGFLLLFTNVFMKFVDAIKYELFGEWYDLQVYLNETVVSIKIGILSEALKDIIIAVSIMAASAATIAKLIGNDKNLEKKFWGAINTMIVLVVTSIGAIIYLFTKLSALPARNFATIGVSLFAGLLSLAAGVASFAFSLVAINFIDVPKVLELIGGIVLIMYGIPLIFNAIAKWKAINYNINDVTGITKAMSLLTTIFMPSLLMFSISMFILSHTDFNALTNVLVRLGAFIGAMMVFIGIFGTAISMISSSFKWTQNRLHIFDGILEVFKSIGTFVGSFALIMIAINFLPENWVPKLIGFTAILTAMFALMSIISAGIMNIMGKNRNGLPNVVQMKSLADFMKSFSSIISAFTTAAIITQMVPTSKLVGLSVAIGIIIFSMTNIFKSISAINGLKGGVKTIGVFMSISAFLYILSALFNSLSAIPIPNLAAITVLVSVFLLVIDAVMLGIKQISNMDDPKQMLMYSLTILGIIGIMHQLGETFAKIAPYSKDIEDAIPALWNIVGAISVLEIVITGITALVAGTGGYGAIGLAVMGVLNLGIIALLTVLGSVISQIGESAQKLSSAIPNIANALTQLSSLNVSLPSSFGFVNDLNASLTSLYEGIKNIDVQVITNFCNTVYPLLREAPELLNVLTINLKYMMTELGNNAVNVLQNLGTTFAYLLQTFPEFSKIIDEAIEKIETAIDEVNIENLEGINIKILDLFKLLAQSIDNTMIAMFASFNKNLQNGAFNSGINFMDGFISGITSKEDTLLNTINEMTKKIMDKWNIGFQIHSPSKLTYQSGEYFYDGFINGIEHKHVKLTNDEIAKLPKEILSELQKNGEKELKTSDSFISLLFAERFGNQNTNDKNISTISEIKKIENDTELLEAIAKYSIIGLQSTGKAVPDYVAKETKTEDKNKEIKIENNTEKNTKATASEISKLNDTSEDNKENTKNGFDNIKKWAKDFGSKALGFLGNLANDNFKYTYGIDLKKMYEDDKNNTAGGLFGDNSFLSNLKDIFVGKKTLQEGFEGMVDSLFNAGKNQIGDDGLPGQETNETAPKIFKYAKKEITAFAKLFADSSINLRTPLEIMSSTQQEAVANMSKVYEDFFYSRAKLKMQQDETWGVTGKGDKQRELTRNEAIQKAYQEDMKDISQSIANAVASVTGKAMTTGKENYDSRRTITKAFESQRDTKRGLEEFYAGIEALYNKGINADNLRAVIDAGAGSELYNMFMQMDEETLKRYQENNDEITTRQDEISSLIEGIYTKVLADKGDYNTRKEQEKAEMIENAQSQTEAQVLPLVAPIAQLTRTIEMDTLSRQIESLESKRNNLNNKNDPRGGQRQEIGKQITELKKKYEALEKKKAKVSQQTTVQETKAITTAVNNETVTLAQSEAVAAKTINDESSENAKKYLGDDSSAVIYAKNTAENTGLIAQADGTIVDTSLDGPGLPDGYDDAAHKSRADQMTRRLGFNKEDDEELFEEYSQELYDNFTKKELNDFSHYYNRLQGGGKLKEKEQNEYDSFMDRANSLINEISEDDELTGNKKYDRQYHSNGTIGTNDAGNLTAGQAAVILPGQTVPMTIDPQINPDAPSDILAQTMQMVQFLMPELINDIGRALPTFMDIIEDKFVAMMMKVTRNVVTDPMFMAAFKSIGYDTSAGLAEGIDDGGQVVENASRGLISKRVIGPERDEGDTHSPSRKTMAIGKDLDDGLAIGIEENGDFVEEATRNLCGNTLDTLEDALTKAQDDKFSDLYTPVISQSAIPNMPKYNMSYINDNLRNIQQKFLQNGGENAQQQEKNISFTFTQNNNSPKALSASEIYRQTNNAISKVKGALDKI